MTRTSLRPKEWRFEKKWKDSKTWKSRSEEKVVGFSSALVFPARKWVAVTQGGTMETGG